MTASSLIRVADAPSLKGIAVPRAAVANAGSEMQSAPSVGTARSPLFVLLLLWALVHVTKFLYNNGTEPWAPYLIYARYLLWPAILLAVGVHVSRRGFVDLRRNVGYLLPFLVIGLISSVAGIWLIESLRQVVFWLLCVLCAASVGAEIDSRNARSALFWAFFVMVAACMVVAIVVPDFATRAGTRYELGTSWHGLFAGKNLLGLICVFQILITIFADDQPRYVRIVAGAVGAVTLMFTASQGSMVTVAGAAGYLMLLAVLRRSRLSVGLRALTLGATTMSALLFLYFLSAPLLELLGRDATFTGRTFIWEAFFARARELWLIGGGPGSFSNQVSPYVADLAYRFRSFGTIYTPHNMYIAALGEIGVFGLLAFVGPICYFAFVLPFRNQSPRALAAATFAFTMLVAGMSEARELFGIGQNMFLLVLMVAIMNRETRERASVLPTMRHDDGAQEPPERMPSRKVLGA